MIFKLLSEAYLVERFTFDELWDRYKNKLLASNIDREFFEQCLKEYDPTADKQSSGTAGEYAEFITRILVKEGVRALNTGIYEIELPSQYEGLITIPDTLNFKQLLTEFDKNKMFFKIRDINRYQSTQELADAFSTIELSKKQIQKLRRSTMLDNKVVFVGKNYTVFNPQTWEAMSSFATLSGWCDADTRPEYGRVMFDKYAPTYVLVPNSQLNGTTPVAIDKRKNWIQIAPVNSESYGYGYYNGEQDKEKVSRTLLTLTSGEWLEANADVVKAVETEVDNNYPLLQAGIVGIDENSDVQSITLSTDDFFIDLGWHIPSDKVLAMRYIVTTEDGASHPIPRSALNAITNTGNFATVFITTVVTEGLLDISSLNTNQALSEYSGQLIQVMHPLVIKSLNTNFVKFDEKSVTLKFPTDELLAMAPSSRIKRPQDAPLQYVMLSCFVRHYKFPDMPKFLEPETWVKNYIKNNTN